MQLIAMAKQAGVLEAARAHLGIQEDLLSFAIRLWMGGQRAGAAEAPQPSPGIFVPPAALNRKQWK